MKLNQVMKCIEAFAPTALAEKWDNVGLLVGDPQKEITGAVLCLDVTEAVYRECLEKKAQLCICHHPFLFTPTRRIDFSDPYSLLLGKFIQADIAVFAAHTNLDSCVGGVNDVLSHKLGLVVTETFLPSETPFDFFKSVVPGIGRIGHPETETGLFDFYKTTVRRLETPGCHINFDQDRPVKRVLCVGGSYDSEWNTDVLDNHVDVIVCGEMKHHDLVFFARYGVAVLVAGHDATERVILPDFAGYLNGKLEEIRFDVCRPFDYNKVVF